VVESRIRVMAIRPAEDETVLSVEISDSTGNLTALFRGRDRIAGLVWRQGPAARSGGCQRRQPGRRRPGRVLSSSKGTCRRAAGNEGWP
jgi:hypothetical protein